LTRDLTKLLDQYGLRENIIAYVKDEGSNLNVLTNIYNFVVWCEILGLEKTILGLLLWSCFLYGLLVCDNKGKKCAKISRKCPLVLSN
jgi:hypothetical protein